MVVAPIEADSRNAVLAETIAADLATALTRAGVLVTNKPGAALYRLAGILREDSQHTRLTLRLMDEDLRRHLWAHRRESVRGEMFTFDEHDAMRLAAALHPCLRAAEVDRAKSKPDTDLTAYDLTMRALPSVLALDAEGNARALDLLERAIDRDPNHALAIALAAWARVQRVVYHFTESPAEERVQAAALAQRALTLPGDATMLAVLGSALTSLHELETADAVIRRALAVDGSSAWAWSRSGWIDVYNGHAESAIERFTIALELAPHDTLAFNNLVGIGCAHFHAGRFLQAARWQHRALVEHPSAAWVHRTLCPAYVLAGAMEDAEQSVAVLRRHYPDLDVSLVRQNLPPLPQTFSDLVVDGLSAAGLPLQRW
jgi:tetratricopeptide (TPR) repeat protein